MLNRIQPNLAGMKRTTIAAKEKLSPGEHVIVVEFAYPMRAHISWITIRAIMMGTRDQISLRPNSAPAKE
jgi:hypothetical protein